MQISKRAQALSPSPIRKFLPAMNQAERHGVKVWKVQVGDPDLDPPTEFMSTIRDLKTKSIPYAPSPGIAEHTQAWVSYYSQFGVSLKPEDIIPTVGCSEAIMLALMVCTDPGDEVIVFEPLYPSYKAFALMVGVTLVPVTLSIDDNFALTDLQKVREKITPRTKAIIIVNPDNPTGKLWSKEELGGVLGIADEHKLFVIVDETYREIRFEGEPVCLLSFGHEQSVIIVDSVSKRYTLTGARIGCLASRNPDVMHSALKCAQARLSTGFLEQIGTVPLLINGTEYVNRAVEQYRRRQAVVTQALRKIPDVVFQPAMGAFYQTVRLPVTEAEDFVRFMIEDFRHEGQTVMVTPMRDFYVTRGRGLGRAEIRIAYVLNEQDLARAMELLGIGLATYNAL